MPFPDCVVPENIHIPAWGKFPWEIKLQGLNGKKLEIPKGGGMLFK